MTTLCWCCALLLARGCAVTWLRDQGFKARFGGVADKSWSSPSATGRQAVRSQESFMFCLACSGAKSSAPHQLKFTPRETRDNGRQALFHHSGTGPHFGDGSGLVIASQPGSAQCTAARTGGIAFLRTHAHAHDHDHHRRQAVSTGAHAHARPPPDTHLRTSAPARPPAPTTPAPATSAHAATLRRPLATSKRCLVFKST